MQNCFNCQKEYQTKDLRQKYCSRSCAAIANNKLYPRKHLKPFKRPKTKFYICACGKNIDKDAKKCRKCADLDRLDKVGQLSLDFAKTSRGPSIHAYTRQHAKSTMHFYEVLKECIICKYTKYVEICHIKPICSFPGTVELKIVNSLDNLVHLCPNHHKEFDRDLMDNKEKEIVLKGSKHLSNLYMAATKRRSGLVGS
jgi:hypothetical protein